MTFAPRYPDGYYDDNGTWRRTKLCFVDCGENCTCKEPMMGNSKLREKTDEWAELDGAARINLDADGLIEFFKYKGELKEEQYEWSKAQAILEGFIWDEKEKL